ncbi:MAG: UBA/THIF-type NAD/FAD binding protein [Candidatus Parvarchaeum acidiphilum ARMAN-4]|jgi:molybdopterin/thiamine biosynthesis adenylyltransferase|uniref:UBA/THIF-type NAD/FAD binding protein n=1 Tax=Candidatus Parvarchaeum acidiphilum ARMAN-4 TaxID=662760 RepID=D2EF26_PARA4|nr:MAG: UBA/THIF-type NAD/FAD binding protein [Candidatus Parvarchaeum acidiphilum ARMAN-4]
MENKSVLVIGIGAVGSAFLANSAGLFKKVGIFDGDIISKSNLTNQPFYSDFDFSSPSSKVSFAVKKMNAMDKATEYKGYERYFIESDFNVMKDYDLILDFTDSIQSRLIINSGCVKTGSPAVFVSLNDKESVLYFYRGNACFNCIFRNSIGHIKEGCESVISPPGKDYLDFLIHSILDFSLGKIKGDEIRIFNLKNKKVLESNVKRDKECEVCVNNRSNNIQTGFLQICSSGIKFSLGSEIDLKILNKKIPRSEINGDYLFSNNGRKSILISSKGDFLFTGYTKDEAEQLLMSFIPERLYKKEKA